MTLFFLRLFKGGFVRRVSSEAHAPKITHWPKLTNCVEIKSVYVMCTNLKLPSLSVSGLKRQFIFNILSPQWCFNVCRLTGDIWNSSVSESDDLNSSTTAMIICNCVHARATVQQLRYIYDPSNRYRCTKTQSMYSHYVRWPVGAKPLKSAI